MDIKRLFEKTAAYRAFLSDIEQNRPSHAYLFICADEYFLRDYLKIIGALILRAEEGGRKYALIQNEQYSDCLIYPNAQTPALNVEFAARVSEKSQLMPVEDSVKLIIICGAHQMNASAQNKLLKILEEPTKNTIFLLGTVSTEPLLATVKSRLKKIYLGGYDRQDAADFLKTCGIDDGMANTAAAVFEGHAGQALEFAKHPDTQKMRLLCRDIVSGAATVKNAGFYSRKIAEFDTLAPRFLWILKTFFRDIISAHCGQDLINNDLTADIYAAAKGYCTGAAIHAVEALNRAERNLHFNANTDMQAQRLILEILKGKHIWQKL